ncbi:MAG: TIGR02147 family protein [Bdellovibrionales bacterium]
MDPKRPIISEYQDPAEFVRDRLQYRKKTERGFSIHRAVRSVRRISPALVSLIVQKKRKITLDRADDFAKLMGLNASEKSFFREWIEHQDRPLADRPSQNTNLRREVNLGILSDWLNIYVKDFFQIQAVQKHPELLEQQLRAIASSKRVQKALQFLLHEGYLRRTLDGRIEVETNLAVAEPQVPSSRVRQFHKGALKLAKMALDLYPTSERLANTLIIPLDEKQRAELLALIDDFGEKLRDFAARKPESGNRLYQLIINLSPVGGKLE